MTNITIKSNFTLQQLAPALKRSIIQSTLTVQEKAVENAPIGDYRELNKRTGGTRQGGTLRRSIHTINNDLIGTVGSDVPYAKLREYINKKNPHTKFYMKRALDSSSKEIEDIFTKNILNHIIKLK